MSQAFFDSAYCEMELEIARRKVLKTNRNCLIPVMVKPWEGIPEELLKVTYISIEDQQLLQKITSILGIVTRTCIQQNDYCGVSY